RKLFPNLKLAKVLLVTGDKMYAFYSKRGENWRQYEVYVRSRDSYGKVFGVLKQTKSVVGVWRPALPAAMLTVDRLPRPKASSGIPLDQPHNPDSPVHKDKKKK